MKECKLTCIMCPRGCSLSIKEENDKIEVKGNKCPRGVEYALNELSNPQRILTSTIKIDTNAVMNRLAVYSSTTVNKTDLIPLCRKLKDVVAILPVKSGDIVCTIDDIDFIASSSVE